MEREKEGEVCCIELQKVQECDATMLNRNTNAGNIEITNNQRPVTKLIHHKIVLLPGLKNLEAHVSRSKEFYRDGEDVQACLAILSLHNFQISFSFCPHGAGTSSYPAHLLRDETAYRSCTH